MATHGIEALAQGLSTSWAAAGDPVEERIVLAGNVVALRFAGADLRRRLWRAFAHLAAPDAADPRLTVHLWDSASTGAPPPPLPEALSGGAAGALYHVHEPPLRAAYRPGLGTGTLEVLDAERGEAWYWAADVSAQPSWEEACPIRQILFWFLEPLGYLQVHGAAVGTGAGGVLLAGAPGSGKSTVALGSLRSSLLYAGDDYVAVSTDPVPRVASIYNSGKLDRSHAAERLPHLLPLADAGDDDEKAVIYVHEHFPERTTGGFPLAAVLLPRLHAESETRIRAVPRAAALAALAPTTLFQLHTGGKAELAALARLIAHVPSCSLELGADLDGVPETILDFLARL